jgi:hypothetical protein
MRIPDYELRYMIFDRQMRYLAGDVGQKGPVCRIEGV